MSFPAMTWAVNQKLPAMQKIVLLMLANRATTDSFTCYPSHDRIAEDCGMDKRSAIRQIEILEKSGLLTVERRTDGKNKLPNLYKLNISPSDRESLGVVTESHKGSDRESLGVVTESHKGSDTESQGVVTESHKGSDRKSQGVVTESHKGSDRKSQGVVTESHIKQSIETVKDITTTTTNKNVEKIELTKNEKLCYEWAIREDYWQKAVYDTASFLKIWNNPKGTLKNQFARYLQQKDERNAKAELKAQKSQSPAANENSGLNSNGTKLNGGNYARTTRTKQPKQFTADYYTSDTTPF